MVYPREPRIKPFVRVVRMGYLQFMKRLCLTCKNTGCVNYCRFEDKGKKVSAPKIIQLKA
jgi:hypothetical protein